ncbi:protein kinase domain-containing protein [Citrus sinensis]|uniref:Protein kinase domain-containing protein n=1 Tax=Citrus sinensis TaxID=2711 RepID=A0ACB8J313_CITSI|nr:protein kinase domain-containing protein [Citrus sinensis]
MSDRLSKPTSIFGLRLWVVVGVCVGAAFVLLLFIISLWFTSKTKRSKTKHKKPSLNDAAINDDNNNHAIIPVISKDIPEVRIHPASNPEQADPMAVTGSVIERQALLLPLEEESPTGYNKIHVHIGKDNRICYPGNGSGGGSGDQVAAVVPEVSHLGWGHWYTLRELEVSTNGFSDDKVIGEGGYGIVYYGLLEDNSKVAVKNLLNNRLSYLHEGLEPKVVHRDIKSSNILIDKHWNPKVSDFGLAKLLGSESSYITTRVMGTFGYVAPEYASTGMLNERSDVYSFGILIMEVISGRIPVDYSRPPEEVNLIEWLKKMVTNRNPEGVLDPKLPEKPTSRLLKRILLVALRCVDPNAQKRPKMGHVVHMLEAQESPSKEPSNSFQDRYRASPKNELIEKQVTESGDNSTNETGVHTNETRWQHQEFQKEKH